MTLSEQIDQPAFLDGVHIALGISGGIAAYKSPLLIRLLKKAGAEVRVLASESALKFTTRWTLETLSENSLETEVFPENAQAGTHHISAAEWADLFVVAPVTANLLGKVAAGISDDALTTTLCAYSGPVMLAPAMNSNMYLNPVTKKNLAFLRSIGYTIIDPEEGEMACHTVGIGRMAEPTAIFSRIVAFLSEKKTPKRKSRAKPPAETDTALALAGRKVIVTAGPCREKLDPVRYISNFSSGRMGYALAAAARGAGADVTLISGPTELAPPDNVAFIAVESTSDMLEAVMAHIDRADALLMAAAPADYAPLNMAAGKIKKHDSALHLELAPTADILKQVAKRKHPGLAVVGFALETENLIENATGKLKDKTLDMIVANSAAQPGSGPGALSNQATIISDSGQITELPLMPKRELADKIITLLAEKIRQPQIK